MACDPGPIRIPLRGDVVDLIVAIDTSGSMIPHIPLVNAWLVSKLEPELRKAGIDYQLQVVVDVDDLSWMGNPSRKGAHNNPAGKAVEEG